MPVKRYARPALKVVFTLLIFACVHRSAPTEPGPETPVTPGVSPVRITVPRSCDDPQVTLRWGNTSRVPVPAENDGYALTLDTIPPEEAHAFIAEQGGCSDANGRIAQVLATREHSTGRIAFGVIETSCGKSWNEGVGQVVVWLDGAVPYDYPELTQGYQLLTRRQGPCGIETSVARADTLVLGGVEETQSSPDCRCRDAQRFYRGRAPTTVSVCEPGTASETRVGPSGSIASALADNTQRVIVSPGLYREDITLRPGVQLVAEIPGSAVIVGSITCADDTLLDGFVITGGSPGVACAASGARIVHNIIRGNWNTGVLCSGCDAEIAFNTIIGNLPGDAASAGVRVRDGAPNVHDNIVLRHDIALDWTGDGDEHRNWLFDNRTPVTGRMLSTTSRTSDPQLFDVARDDFRLQPGSPAFGAGALGPDRWLSRAAQEYAVEAFFNTHETPSGLVSQGMLVPPSALTYVVNDVPDAAVVLFRAAGEEIARGTTTVTPGSGPACEVVTITRSPDQTRGEAYVSGGTCSTSDTLGGAIIGGRMLLASEVLDNLDDADTRINVTHESGHVFGLRHVFRAVSPMAYGPQRADFSGVDADALALHMCTDAMTLAEWRARSYIWNDVLEPFPAIERTATIAGRLHLFGSRFTLRFGSEAGPVDPANPISGVPVAHFRGRILPIDMTLTETWHGGVTRNIEIDLPEELGSGWLSIESRGLMSIPIWIAR